MIGSLQAGLMFKAANAFVPTNVAGCKLWLRGDLGVTQSGGTVSLWADQSGNANDYSQGTAANQPTFTASAINALPGLSFDGTNDVLTSSFQISGAKTIFMVRKLSSVPGAGAFFTPWNLNSGSLESEEIYVNSAGYQPTSFAHDRSGLITVLGTADALDTAAHVEQQTYDGGTNTSASSYTERLDATTQTVVTSSLFGVPGLGASLGARANNSLNYAGIIAEFIVYDTALSGANLTLVRNYLGARYGISV